MSKGLRGSTVREQNAHLVFNLSDLGLLGLNVGIIHLRFMCLVHFWGKVLCLGYLFLEEIQTCCERASSGTEEAS